MTENPRCRGSEGHPLAPMRTPREPTVEVRRRALRWLLAASFGTGLLPATVFAAEVPEADAKALRAVIEAQLEAFAANDAERAFSFASPSIHALFGDALTFMAMVQGRYPMLVRPLAVTFLIPQANGDTLWQVVHLRDRLGRPWLATYRLEKQGASEDWRIRGCVVVPDDGRSST